MALAHSPKITTSDLSLSLDAGNPKSYPGTGTTWNDLSGNNRHFTLDNTTFSTQNGGSMVFNGTNSSSFSSSSITINYANGGTFEMVFRSTDIATSRAQGYMQHIEAGTQNYINFYSATNRMRWEVIGSNAGFTAPYGWYSNRTLENNTWYHVVGTFSNTGITRLYINGIFDKEVIQTTYPTGNITNTIYIGNYSGFMSGDIPMCRIYNRNLSPTEILQNFNAFRGRYGI